LNASSISITSGLNLGHPAEAITYFDKVLEIDSLDIEATYGKAIALESLGRVEEALTNLEEFIEQEPPDVEFRVPPEGTVNQAGVEEIAENDQTLFVIVAVFIVILISIIVIDLFARRKSVLKVETAPETKQTILSKPSGTHDIQFVEKVIKSEEKLESISQNEKQETNETMEKTNLEVNQALKVLRNLKDMNMLDNAKTAKQFLLNKGFSPSAVKKAMLDMNLVSNHDNDL